MAVVNDFLRNSLRMQNHIMMYLRVTSATGVREAPGALQLSYPLNYSIHRVLFNLFNLIVSTIYVILMQFMP